MTKKAGTETLAKEQPYRLDLSVCFNVGIGTCAIVI